jgi:DNA replication and repair protein RecF
MISLKNLQLINFRNFQKLDLAFSDGINAIIGPNAVGKTTILEAIHILSTGRSFKSIKLNEAIRKGEKFFSIRAEFTKDSVDQSLIINYHANNKEIKHNATSYTSFTPLFGLLPSVIYSPFDIDLIHGAPSERRRFINILIAQANPLYVYYLTRYTKAIDQRNSLLRKKDSSQIEIWEEELIKSGDYLQSQRYEFIKKLNEKSISFFNQLSQQKESIQIVYESSKISRDSFDKIRGKELLIGHTLIGPHRDDFGLKINELCAKNYASEGQKRCVIAALKLAECELLTPSILLIDDFGVHLDGERKKKFEQLLKTQSQLFLTSPFHLDEIKQASSHFLQYPAQPALTLP